ncbi:MAG: hypothetical protein IPG54_10070 [Sphingomonadales bacterium]|nr:hypothetical protein [Sphingomonadales bacterium]MBK9004055.1 hypothetical protein [Sphingomonadales bacterium]MBK9269230.1 hypothetical protein [Sphingomonadales bacterium]MBP6433754.1 hypothetical protein [Sphingorhabdus sp.]
MTLAMKRLKNLGWLALVFMIAVLLYPLSLNVAALHSDLLRIDREILETSQEINFLQAEIRTRASVAQLEEWNELLYGYEPPRADQFIDGERGLARLGGSEPLVKPVLVAVDTPAGEIGGGGAAASSILADASAAIRTVASDDREERVADARLATDKPKETKAKSAETVSRTERLARMDDTLLSDSLMREIQTKSDKERKRQ